MLASSSTVSVCAQCFPCLCTLQHYKACGVWGLYLTISSTSSMLMQIHYVLSITSCTKKKKRIAECLLCSAGWSTSANFLFSFLNKCTKTGQIQWYHQYLPEFKRSTMLQPWLCQLLPLVLCSCHYEVNIKQCFSNCGVYQNLLGDLLQYKLLPSLPLPRVSGSSLRWGLGICISHRLLSASEAPGPETKLWESGVGNMWVEVSWNLLVREGKLGSF